MQKIILDATAGNRMMWVNKQNPFVLYVDQKADVNPDEVQDFRHLPYPDSSFELVVFDPPHTIHNHPKVIGNIMRDYGWLEAETWQSDLKRGFAECWRVLQPKGVLIFKWGETDKPLKAIIPFFPAEPLFWQKSAGSTSRAGKSCGTYWVCFKKLSVELLSNSSSERKT